MDVATLAELLRETAERHHPYEQSAPDHDWSEWYAAYLHSRLEGTDSERAYEAAGVHVERVLGGS